VKLAKHDWVIRGSTEVCPEKRLLRREGKDGYTEDEHKEDSK